MAESMLSSLDAALEAASKYNAPRAAAFQPKVKPRARKGAASAASVASVGTKAVAKSLVPAGATNRASPRAGITAFEAGTSAPTAGEANTSSSVPLNLDSTPSSCPVEQPPLLPAAQLAGHITAQSHGSGVGSAQDAEGEGIADLRQQQQSAVVTPDAGLGPTSAGEARAGPSVEGRREDLRPTQPPAEVEGTSGTTQVSLRRCQQARPARALTAGAPSTADPGSSLGPGRPPLASSEAPALPSPYYSTPPVGNPGEQGQASPAPAPAPAPATGSASAAARRSAGAATPSGTGSGVAAAAGCAAAPEGPSDTPAAPAPAAGGSRRPKRKLPHSSRRQRNMPWRRRAAGEAEAVEPGGQPTLRQIIWQAEAAEKKVCASLPPAPPGPSRPYYTRASWACCML
eukprot:jgi/Mesen1/9323/ME000061S08769